VRLARRLGPLVRGFRPRWTFGRAAVGELGRRRCVGTRLFADAAPMRKRRARLRPRRGGARGSHKLPLIANLGGAARAYSIGRNTRVDRKFDFRRRTVQSWPKATTFAAPPPRIVTDPAASGATVAQRRRRRRRRHVYLACKTSNLTAALSSPPPPPCVYGAALSPRRTTLQAEAEAFFRRAAARPTSPEETVSIEPTRYST